MLLKRASNCAESLYVHVLGLPNKILKLGSRNHQIFVVSEWSQKSEFWCQRSHLPLKFLGGQSVFASPTAATCCCCLITQSYLTLCNPMGCSPPGSSVHGILQARILEWVAISFSRGSSRPGIQPTSSALQVDSSPQSHQGSPSVGIACP